MEEYIVDVDHHSDLQKKLNQWRHQYSMEVLCIFNFQNGFIGYCIRRTKKEKE